MPGLIDAGCHVTYATADTDPHSRERRPGRVYNDAVELMRACLTHGTVGVVAMASAGSSDFKSDIAVLRQLSKIGTNPVHAVRTWDLPRPPAGEPETREYLLTAEILSRRGLLDGIQVPSTMACRGGELLPPGLPVGITWIGAEDIPLESLLRQAQPRSVTCRNPFTKQELEALAEWTGVCVFTPTLRSSSEGASQLRDAADAGCAIALASGYHPLTSLGYSMQMAISLAVLIGNLTTEEAITAATVNSAWAAGRGHSVGTLERGKVADILVMSVPDYRDITRQFGINNATTVLRAGEVVFNRRSWKRGTHASNSGQVRTQHL